MSCSSSAGVIISELGRTGNVIRQHPKVAITKPGDYTELAATFTTLPAASAVRFTLDTVIACRYDQGSVTYDDCALTVPPGRSK